jgi:hypothetical protein
MKRVVVVMTVLALAATTAAVAQEKPKEVHGAGCVQAGVEARCLVVKDVKSGTLYNIMIKEPRPAIGEGIEFSGTVHEGVTVCMEGVAVAVTSWTKKESLKCGKP